METTEKFSVSIVGEKTGNVYAGDFTVKTVLTRRDEFIADSRRRELLGANPEGALPQLQVEAFMYGQLFVRIVQAPKFWSDAGNGIDLADLNVISKVYETAKDKEEERIKKVKAQAEEALKQIAKA